MPKLRSLLLTVAGLLVACTTMAAAQADYPNRPVRLIIPFPPGGSNDVVGRMIGDQLGKQLGKQVFNITRQVALIAFTGQHVILFLCDNLLGNRNLAAECINRDHAPLQVKHLEQQRTGSDLIRFVGRADLSEHQAVGR